MLDQRVNQDRREGVLVASAEPMPPSNGALGFIVFSDVVVTNPPGSFNGLKVTESVCELKRYLHPAPNDINERAFQHLLEEIRNKAYDREWISLTVRTGIMCLPEGSREAFQVIWVPGDGVINSAIWYKK
jgi:hypothetical protein